MGFWDNVASDLGMAGGTISEPIASGAEDLFSAETVNQYQADPNAFVYGQMGQQGTLDARNLRDYQMQQASGLQGQAAAQAQYGVDDANIWRRQAAAQAAAQAAGQQQQAGVLTQQAGMAGGRSPQIARGLGEIQGQYGAYGVGAQQNAMQALGDIAAGQTAAQTASMQSAGQMAGMGGQAWEGSPEQREALGRAVAAQQQTADTSAMEAAGARMAGLADSPTVRGQIGASDILAARGQGDIAGLGTEAGRLAAFGRGDIAGQQTGIQGLEGFADRGMGPSAAEAQLRAGSDRAIAGQMALARSGRGGGGAAALRQAQANAAAIQQQTSGQAAQLRAQEEAQWRGQQLGALQAAQQARGTLGGQQLSAQQAALQARGTLGAQQTAALEAAQQGYGAATGSQLAALQGATQAQTQALSARDAAQARSLQALGIEAQQAQALGGQSLQGQAQQLAALQAAQQAYQGQAALQAQAAGAGAGAGAQYAGQQLAATQANVQAQQQQRQINDAMRLGLLQQAGARDALAAQYAQQGQQGALDWAALQQGYQQAGMQNQLAAAQFGQQGALGFSQLGETYDTNQLQAAMALEQLRANQSLSAQTANQQADLEKDAGITGMIGSGIGALAAMSDIRAKRDITSGDKMSEAFAASMKPAYESPEREQPKISSKEFAEGFGSGYTGRSEKAYESGAEMGGGIGSLMGALSDEKSKEELRRVKGQLAGVTQSLMEERGELPSSNALQQAPGYSYQYKPEFQKPPYNQPSGTQYGPMAQDLERTPVGRTAVNELPDGTKTIDTNRLALINAAATGEQAGENEQLRRRLDALESDYVSRLRGESPGDQKLRGDLNAMESDYIRRLQGMAGSR